MKCPKCNCLRMADNTHVCLECGYKLTFEEEVKLVIKRNLSISMNKEFDGIKIKLYLDCKCISDDFVEL